MNLSIRKRPAAIFLSMGLCLSFGAPATKADDVKMTPELVQKILDKVRRNAVDSESKQQADPAMPFALKALRLARAKRYERAIRVLQDASDKYPASALVRYQLAWVYGEMGRWSEALGFARSALEIKPRAADTYFLCDLAYTKLGRFEEAVKAYKKAIELDPVNSENYNNLGNALLFLKRYGDALDAYRRAIELNPSDAVTFNNLGETYRQTGRQREAVAAYRNAIELRADFAVAYVNMAGSFIALEEFEAAAEALARAVRIEPDHPEWRFNLGVIALKLSKREIAVRRRENEFAAPLAKGDSVALTRLLADDYRFTGVGPVPSNKTREVSNSSLLVPDAVTESITTEAVSVLPAGNSYVVKGQMIIRAISAGQPLCGQFSYERVYAHRNKRWRVASDKVDPVYASKARNSGCRSTSNYLKQLFANR